MAHFTYFMRTLACAPLSVCFALLLNVPHSYAATADVELYFRPACDHEFGRTETILGPIPDIEELVSLGHDDCLDYSVEDPTTLVTPKYRSGDEFSIDVALRNPSQQAIRRVRSWLAFDPNILEVIGIQAHPKFPQVTPGELDTDVENGYVMIEVSTDSDDVTKAVQPSATVSFRVKLTPPTGTIISFYDAQNGGHTAVYTKEGEEDAYVLSGEPGSLHVVFLSEGDDNADDGEGEPDSGEGEASDIDDGTTLEDIGNALAGLGEGNGDDSGDGGDSAGDTSDLVWDGGECSEDSDCWSVNCVEGICTARDAPSENPTDGDPGEGSDDGANNDGADDGTNNGEDDGSDVDDSNNDSSDTEPTNSKTAFALLQVQNVRATTEGSSLYVGWDSLNSSSLKAYNIYYGTTTGRYIQRKTVDGSMQSLIIRALPLGETYYVAVRAVSTDDEESAFSQEVSVTIGDPDSSTAPLVAGAVEVVGNPLEGNVNGEGEPLVVPGETGAPSVVLLLIILSGVIGTMFAARRQVFTTFVA